MPFCTQFRTNLTPKGARTPDSVHNEPKSFGTRSGRDTDKLSATRGASMPRRISVIFAAIFLVTCRGSVSGIGVGTSAASDSRDVVTWEAPLAEQLFQDYTLRVNGHAVPVYACRVSAMPFNQVWPGYQRPVEQTELAGFAYWGMSRPVSVEIISGRPFNSVAVRPSARGLRPIINGQRITFQISQPGQFTVELDGSHHALHLFADPPETDAPKPGDPNVLYFGAGVHRPGKILLKSGQTVYVAGGAVVYTAIEGRGVSGVRILGRGIIDTSEFARGQGGGSIHLEDSSEIKIDGVIVRDSDLYGVSAFGCHKLAISRVKLIGFWRYNSDGIDMCNTQEVTVRNSFIRSFDDSMVLKGVKGRSGGARPLPGQSYDGLPVRNIRMSGLVIWCDWGRALEIGAETSAPEMTDVVFRNIDVIRNTHIAMDIQHSDRAAIHDIRYEDVRVEVDDSNPLPVIQNKPGEKYNPRPEVPAAACGGCATLPGYNGYIPNLFVIVIHPTAITRDKEAGTVRDVLFKNISVTGKTMLPSAFTGLDAAHDVRGVTIENLRFNGHPITNPADAHLQVGKFAEEVRFRRD